MEKREVDISATFQSRALYNPLCLSVRRSVRWSVVLSFFGVYRRFWGYCSCPTAWLVKFIIAPVHSRATRVAVYTALFMILCRINKEMSMGLFEHANTRKHVYEHSCSSVRAFLRILAHLAHLAQSILSDFKYDK